MSTFASPPAAEPLPPDQRGTAAPTAVGRSQQADTALACAWKNVAGYAAAACASMAVTAFVLQLWRADLTVPLFDGGDDLTVLMNVRTIQDTGWFLDNPRLGAPGVYDLRDYPTADVLHFAVIKMLLYAIPDPVVVFNLFILLPFPLTALSAYFVFRRLRLGRLAALVPSVLYACMLYHFVRIGGHACLAAYYLLPPMLWLALRVSLGRNPLLRADAPGDRPRWRLRSWQAAGAALLCILIGLGGVYYAFFSCFFLLAAGAKACVRERRWAPAGAAAVLILLVAGAVVAALTPSLVHHAIHGANPAVAARLPGEADMYGLSVGEMLLPTPSHRVAWLARVVGHYGAAPHHLTGEWNCQPLGIVTAVGFLYLIGRFLLRLRDRAERAEDGLAFLNLAAVLLGTIGGFGSVFAFWVSPMIRCYNRISICIAFFALAGLFLLLHRLTQRYVRGRWTRAAWAVGLVALLAAGALDQTSPVSMTPQYAEERRQFTSDVDFGRRIEEALPAGSMVYQMPYVPFPEAPPVAQLPAYELLRPFLHTRTLRFSYGAMMGRETDFWTADLSKRPTPVVVERLAIMGFGGVYLDRRGFADNGAQIEEELSCLLGVEPLVSLTQQQSFFDMTAYVQALRARFTDEEWKERKDRLLHPIWLRWAGSFRIATESAAEGTWRWCGAEGQLHLINPWSRPQHVVLRMQCSGLVDQKTPSRLVVDGAGERRELSLTGDQAPLELDLTVAPGDHVVRFSCDGRSLATEVGPIVFRLWNFEYGIEE